jgi:hypothetical protein
VGVGFPGFGGVARLDLGVFLPAVALAGSVAKTPWASSRAL